MSAQEFNAQFAVGRFTVSLTVRANAGGGIDLIPAEWSPHMPRGNERRALAGEYRAARNLELQRASDALAAEIVLGDVEPTGELTMLVFKPGGDGPKPLELVMGVLGVGEPNQ